MSKHRVLSLKPQLRLERQGQDGQNETEQPDHSASLGDSITSSSRIRFSVHTGMYLGKDNNKALQLFLRGRDLNDADSMVSLADMIDKGTYTPDNPVMMKLNLLKRAADLGHVGAQRGFPLELQKAQQSQNDQEKQRQMMDMFGHILGSAIRR